MIREIDKEEFLMLELKGLIKRDAVSWHGFKRDAPYLGISCTHQWHNYAIVCLLHWPNNRREYDITSATADAFTHDGQVYIWLNDHREGGEGKWYWVYFYKNFILNGLTEVIKEFTEMRNNSNG